MTNILNRGLVFFIFSVILFFSSCIKEEFDPKKLDTDFVINPGVAAPLGYMHYELDEVLNDPTRSWEITIGNDSLIYLQYEAEVLSETASGILQIDQINTSGYVRDTSQNVDFRFERYPHYNPIQTDTVYLKFTNAFSDDPLIDSIRVRSMDIHMSYSTQYDELDGRLIVRSHNIKKKLNGKWGDWSVAKQLNHLGLTNTVNDIIIIPVSNSVKENMIPLIIDFRPTFCAVSVPKNYPILQYIITIDNIEYTAIFGYLGKFSFNIPSQEILIDFYSDLKEGTFNFTEPQMKFYFENSFGLPIQILANELYATSPAGVITAVQGPGLPSEENPFIINFPTINDFGENAYDSISIDQDNTNLDSVLMTSPSSITFGIEARTNPSGKSTYNFITENSQLNIKSKLILPIIGNTKLLSVEDTIMYSFADFFRNPPREIKRMALRLNFTNGFPVDISSQVYLLDENRNLVDSVFNEVYIIKAGTDINNDGYVEPLKSEAVEVELTREKINNLAISRYLYFKGRLNTHNSDIPENYKFYSFYFLDAYIGAVGELELNSTGN
jgi:hypothetical protein